MRSGSQGESPLPLVGRELELETVERILDSLSGGRGGVLLLAGESGIGKTRLAETTVARARSRGARTIWTSTWYGAGSPPLWLWTQVLRSLGAADLLLDHPVQDTADAADAARFHQFDNIANALRAAAGENPLVVVLDDLQWADVASLRLLAFVARATRDVPCLLVATVRPDELPADEIAALVGLGTTVALGGLDVAAVREVLTTIVGSAVAMDASELVAARSGGNPLFVCEFGRLMRSSGRMEVAAAAIPPAIAAVAQRRLARLNEIVIACLQAGAVVGKRFGTEVVERLVGAIWPNLSPASLTEALIEAQAGAVIVRASAAEFAFNHDLLRDVVLETMPVERRRLLHQVAANLLVGRVSADPSAHAEVAAHLEAAGAENTERAGDHWEQAARWSLDMLAYEQAAAWFARARLASRPDNSRSVDLLLYEADARMRSGQLAEGRACYREAAQAARAIGDAARLASAVLGIGAGVAGWEVPTWDESHVELLEDALAFIPNDAISVRALLLARLSVGRATPSSLDVSQRLAEDALDLARQAGDPLAEAQALAARCDALAAPEHARARREHARSIIELAGTIGDRALALLGRRFLVVACLELGDFAQLDLEISRFCQGVEQLRHPLLAWYGPLFRGMRALLRGDIAEAERWQSEVAAAARRTGSMNATLLAITLGMGIDVAGQRPTPADLFDGIGPVDPAVWASYAAGLAFVAMRCGDRTRAEAMLQLHASDGFARLGHDSEHLVSITMFGRVAIWLRDRRAVTRLRELALPHSGLWVVDGIAALCWGPVDLELARLESSLGYLGEAAAHLESARIGLRAAGARLLLRDADELAASVGLTPAAVASGQPLADNLWRCDGELWTLRYDGRTVLMKHAKGLADIARLLAEPGREVAAADLYGDSSDRARTVPPGHLGELLDARARAAYRERLVELEEELTEAEEMHDLGRAESVRAERDFLAAELAAALGLGGRPRLTGDPHERARKAVTNRVRLAVDRVAASHDSLAHHLRHSIRTGVFCSYQPEHPTIWHV